MPHSLRQDLTYAIRSFLKAPTLTVTIIVSIAFGIAANTTVFSVVNELLIKDMPVRDPARLVIMEPGGRPSTSLPATWIFAIRCVVFSKAWRRTTHTRRGQYSHVLRSFWSGTGLTCSSWTRTGTDLQHLS
jgi:hypothetical protein